jgi:hypothetical protein
VVDLAKAFYPKTNPQFEIDRYRMAQMRLERDRLPGDHSSFNYGREETDNRLKGSL